jgi:hypothetical protein
VRQISSAVRSWRAVALEAFVRFGKTVPIQHQAHQHLLGRGTLIARVAALGLRIARRLALEVGRRQIVKVQSLVEMEPRLLAFGQLGFNALPVRMPPIPIAVQRFVAEGGKVRPPISLKAVRSIHSGRACSESGKIRRFSVITSLSGQASSDKPAAAKIAFSPNGCHL